MIKDGSCFCLIDPPHVWKERKTRRSQWLQSGSLYHKSGCNVRGLCECDITKGWLPGLDVSTQTLWKLEQEKEAIFYYFFFNFWVVQGQLGETCSFLKKLLNLVSRDLLAPPTHSCHNCWGLFDSQAAIALGHNPHGSWVFGLVHNKNTS